MSGDPVKLQAQLHKLESQLAEVTKDRDAKAKDLDRLRDLNRRGDAELRRAEAALSSSKDAKNLKAMMEERDVLQQNLKALQDMMRGLLEENANFKKMIADGGSSSTTTSDKAKQTELQDKINNLRAEIKAEEAKVAELNAKAAGGSAPEELEALTEIIGKLKTELAAAEDEAESGASEAIKATRAREKLERENRERLETLESALEAKIRENASFQEKLSEMESAHARDLEIFIGKLNVRETDLSDLRSQLKVALETADALRTQVEESSRKLDDEVKKAVEKALEKSKKDAKEKAVDESVVAEFKVKLEAAQQIAKDLTTTNATLQAAKDAADETIQQLRTKVINREQKLSEAIQNKSIVQTELQEAKTEIASLEKSKEKWRKELKSAMETLRSTKAECERLSAELVRVNVANENLNSELSSARSDLTSTRTRLQETSEALQAAEKLAEDRGVALAQLEVVVAESEARLDDIKSQFNIAVKLTRQLNTELRAQLNEERKKVGKLERELAKSHRPAPDSPATSAMQSPARPPSINGAMGPPAHRPLPSAGSFRVTAAGSGPVAATPERVNSGRMAEISAPDDDTIRLLGERLTAVLAEAEVAREKVRFLEGSIQMLTEELDAKKFLLKQLSGSISSNDLEDVGADMGRLLQSAVRGEDAVALLKGLVEKTMSENARLRRDIKTLGAELVASKQNDAEDHRPEATEGITARPTIVEPPKKLSTAAAASNPFGSGDSGAGNPFGGPKATSNPFDNTAPTTAKSPANPFGTS